MRALARRLGINHSIVSRCLLLMQLPETIRAILDKSPRLITANYVKRFVDYSANNVEIVEPVVKSMNETGLQQEAAIRLIGKEIAALTATTSPKPVGKAFDGLGTMKVAGRKVEFQCHKGIDPERLSAQFEAFLLTIDRSEISNDTH